MSDFTILVVEDDPHVRKSVLRLIQRLGYRTIEAEDGPTALTCISEHPEIDLLFSDVVMPKGMNGFELARQARTIREELRVLFTSGYSDEELEKTAALKTTFKSIKKPYTIDVLAAAFNEALA